MVARTLLMVRMQGRRVPCFRGSRAISPEYRGHLESMLNPRGTACFRRVARRFDSARQERRKHGTRHRRFVFLTINKRKQGQLLLPAAFDGLERCLGML